jgi:hypothetical protein
MAEGGWMDSVFLTTRANQSKLELSGLLPATKQFKNRQDYTSKIRSILVEWLITVVKFLQLRPGSYFRCINLLDAYLARTPDIKRHNLQLTGIAGLLLAAEYNEPSYCDIDDYTTLTTDPYSKKEIRAEGKKIFAKLGCDLGLVPVDIEYYRYVSTASKSSLQAHAMGKYLLTIIKLNKQDFIPSVYATAVKKIMTMIFPGDYVNAYQIVEIVVDVCVAEIVNFCKRLDQSKLVAYKTVAKKKDRSVWMKTFARVCEMVPNQVTVGNETSRPYRRATHYKERLALDLIPVKNISNGLEYLGEGVSSVVSSVKYKENMYALKEIRSDEGNRGLTRSIIREISLGLGLDHPNVAKIRYVSEDLYMMLFDLGQSDLYIWIIDHGPLDEKVQKVLAIQMFNALVYIHSMGCMHRDIKTANIIVYGSIRHPRFVLSDFGLARGPGIGIKQDAWTHEVITIWYRPPEILLGSDKYDEKVDVWSMLCVLFEAGSRPTGPPSRTTPLFPGPTKSKALDLIFKRLGTPTEETWPGVTDLPKYRKLSTQYDVEPDAFSGVQDLSRLTQKVLNRCLILDPADRPEASQVLEVILGN